MNNFLPLMSVILLGLMGHIHAAQEPTDTFDEDTAKTLIADVLDIRKSDMSIANIVDGTKKDKDGFEYTHVKRVSAVHPVLTEGKMVRTARFYDFMWSEKYGWFYQETNDTRGGQEIWIWSQKLGEVIVK